MKLQLPALFGRMFGKRPATQPIAPPVMLTEETITPFHFREMMSNPRGYESYLLSVSEAGTPARLALESYALYQGDAVLKAVCENRTMKDAQLAPAIAILLKVGVPVHGSGESGHIMGSEYKNSLHAAVDSAKPLTALALLDAGAYGFGICLSSAAKLRNTLDDADQITIRRDSIMRPKTSTVGSLFNDISAKLYVPYMETHKQLAAWEKVCVALMNDIKPEDTEQKLPNFREFQHNAIRLSHHGLHTLHQIIDPSFYPPTPQSSIGFKGYQD